MTTSTFDEKVGKSAFVAFLIGVSAGLLFWSYYRVATVKFPLIFLNPLFMVIAVSGAAAGMISAQKRRVTSFRYDLLLGAGLAAFAIGNLLYKDSSVHFLFGSLYYKFPAPTRMVWVMAGHITALFLSPLPYFILARHYTLSLDGGRWSSPSVLIGLAAGLFAANATIPPLGGYTVLFAACILTCRSIRRRAVFVGSAVLIILFGLLLANPKEAFFTWQLRDYERLKSFWTPYYKVDYLSFENDHCLGAVHNTAFVWGVCDEPERQLLIYKRLSQVLAGGDIRKTRVLNVGRTNGYFPLSMKWNNPHLERLLAVEYDKKLTEDLRGAYAKYNAHIFSEQGISSHAEDIRFFLERQTERFDMLYINGAGIMLFFYPVTFITQEDYIFSSDSYQHIFNDILTDNGILLIDRGTNVTSEAYMWSGSMPDDIHIRIFWTKITDYPATGMPLGYVIASKNESELERIARELTEGNIFTEIPYDSELRARYRHTDDKPFMQPDIMKPMSILTLPVFLYLALLIRRHRRHDRRLVKLSKIIPYRAVDSYLIVVFGILSAQVWLWTATRGARAFAYGSAFGFVCTTALFLIGAALIIGFYRRHSRVAKIAGWLALTLCAGGFGMLLHAPFSSWISISSALLGGSAIALLLRSFSSFSEIESRLHLFLPGFLTGILLFQWALFLLGFRFLAVAVCLGFIGYALLQFLRPPRGRTRPLCPLKPEQNC